MTYPIARHGETRAELAARLTAEGIGGGAADMVLAVTARARHEARITAAVQAARQIGREAIADGYASAIDGSAASAIAWLVLQLDCWGIGGPHGVGLGTPSTTRFPGLQSLGSGRKQALDGGAWSAAIDEGRLALSGYTILPPGGGDEVRLWRDGREHVMVFPRPPWIPWWRSMAGRMLLQGGPAASHWAATFNTLSTAS